MSKTLNYTIMMQDALRTLVKNVLKKKNSIVVSRIPKKNFQDICNYCKKNDLKVSTGQNCTTILVYKKPIKKINTVSVNIGLLLVNTLAIIFIFLFYLFI